MVDGKNINSCLGDLYSVNWMEDSDVSMGQNWTLAEQFNKVVKLTDKSHVIEFGTKTMKTEFIDAFQGDYNSAGRGAATEWELRQSRAKVDATKAAAEAAEERRAVERQRLDLELATQQQLIIRAPFDGVVTRLETVPGATLLRTDRPVTVADLTVLEAVMYVPAALWPRLRPGAGYALRLSDPVGRAVPARLRHLDPVMDVASGRFRAVFVIANPDRALPAGLEAELDLRALPE
jgi:multidrug efflux pump subunit AcrA (membrane-fusion protein)